MKSEEGLRLFCEDVAGDQPTPGGGSVSSAAGALSASLLRMVCGISKKAKSKRDYWRQLDELDSELKKAQEDLINLSKRDAEAYERVAKALRADRAGGGKVSEERQEALKQAAEVPAQTARACVRVLEMSSEVARLSTKGVWSDIGVAVLLAEVGVLGASMNVRINISELSDRAFSDRLEEEVLCLTKRAEDGKKVTLAFLESLRSRS